MVAFPTIPKLDYANPASYREFVRPLVDPWMTKHAWIALLDPTNKTTVEDDVTGAVTGVTWMPEWTGYSRIQPMRNPLTLKKAVDSTETRNVQFWIDFPADETIPQVRPGWEIAVMICESDPYLTGYQYYVLGAMNSSLAWQRTIDTSVNQETKPGYDMTGWALPDGGVVPPETP